LRQLKVEGLLLGLCGGGIGLALVAVGRPALVALLPGDLPRWMSFSVDYRVLLFSLVITLVMGVVLALASALSTGSNVTEALKDGGGGGHLRRQRGVRNALVIAEVAVSFVLLAGAGLMVQSFRALRTLPLGYQADHAPSIHLAIPPDKYPSGPRYRDLIDRIGREVLPLPGVTAVGFSSGVPLNGDGNESSRSRDGRFRSRTCRVCITWWSSVDTLRRSGSTSSRAGLSPAETGIGLSS
jgi:putative ABC transport system permease protein